MTLTDNIRAFRTIKGLSQENIAGMLGISSTAYAKIERGETDMSYTRLEQIAKALEVRVTDLINFGENGFYYMNNGSPHGVVINNTSKEATEFIVELQKLKTENEGLRKEVEHLTKIVLLLENKESKRTP